MYIDLTKMAREEEVDVRCGIVVPEKLRPITRSLNGQKLHGLEGMNHVVDYITSNRANTSETIE